jgi:hypothetical protein
MNTCFRLPAAAFLFCLACAASAHGPAPDTSPQPRAAPAANPNTNARGLTLALLDAANQYNTGAPAAKGLLLANLINVAKARKDELVLTAQADPAEFMRVILPAELLAGLPPQAMPFLEQSATVSGSLEVFHVDHVNPADDYYEHVLTTTSNATYKVHFAVSAPDLQSGIRISVRGVRLDNHIVVAAAGDVMVVKAVSVLGNTLGAQKTLVILVNFSDAPSLQPYTVAQAQSIVFTTTSNYDLETSYQQTSLTGTVAGWFTIAETSAGCNYSTIAAQAKQAAANAGYVLSSYNRYVYAFPSNTCSWWGLGSVGGNPSQAWIHTKYGFTLSVTAHEMGHNFGLYHSHSLDCGAAVVAGSGCTISEYGDVFDIMGNSSGGHFNAYHKERLGWLNAGVSPPLTTVPAGTTATYTIGQLETARDSVPRALKIPRGTSCSATNEYFYVETRRNVTGGVVVHRITDGSVDSSYLLDMTPATSSWTDAALATNLTFVDPATGLAITPMSVTSSGAQVKVAYPAASCVRAAPTMSFTPTGAVWTSAGAQVSYAVSVKNNDSCGCSATAFDATATVPAGWASSSAHSASITPGASTSTSVVVSAAAAALPGFYAITLSAANSSASTMAMSAPGTVAISTALAVAASADQATYILPKQGNATVNAVISSKVTSSGTLVAGASVTVVVRDASGKSSTLSGVTLSDGIARVTYTMRSKNAPTGTYIVTSTAKIGSVTGSGTATFAVGKQTSAALADPVVE